MNKWLKLSAIVVSSFLVITSISRAASTYIFKTVTATNIIAEALTMGGDINMAGNSITNVHSIWNPDIGSPESGGQLLTGPAGTKVSIDWVLRDLYNATGSGNPSMLNWAGSMCTIPAADITMATMLKMDGQNIHMDGGQIMNSGNQEFPNVRLEADSIIFVDIVDGAPMNGVGIGTTDPDTVFHIKSAGPNPTIKFESTVVDEVTVLRFDNNRTTDGDIAALIQFYNEGAAPITGIRSFRGSSDTAGDLAFRTSDLERMRIDEDGNVGIGVTDPEAKLEINGQIKIISGGLGLGRVLTSDEYGLATWEATALSTDETAEHDTAKMKADTIVFVDDVDGLPIGGVGIGVLDPEQPLHIKSPSGNAFIKLESDAGVEWTMGVEGEDNFIIRDDTGDDKRFVIDSSGNIGIGVSDPDAKLEVNGQIKITGGTPGAAKVLTSDANGLATWETASSSGLAASATNQVLIDAKAYTDTSTNANLTVALAKIVVSTNANLTVAKAYTDTATNTLAGLRTTNVYYEISEKTAQTLLFLSISWMVRP